MARILLTEDDDSVRNFLQRALSLDGHQITSACDGSMALEYLSQDQNGFDLLLTDIQMPIMDGIALALSAVRDYPSMPILLMTGYAHQRERAYGLDTLVKDIVMKPFTLADIRAKITVALDE